MKVIKVLTDQDNTQLNDATWLMKKGEIEIIAGTKDDYDLLLFTGGYDVSPIIYGEHKVGFRTGSNWLRDKECLALYKQAVEDGKPMLGICRGSQFLTAASGGKLIQHVTDHAGITHKIRTHSGELVDANSTHHQMMFPFNMKQKKYHIMAWAHPSRSTMYLNGRDKSVELPKDFVEPEIVYYWPYKALAIQGHPEFLQQSHQFSILCRSIVYNTILKDFNKEGIQQIK